MSAPAYAPREGTKLAEACKAIAAAGGLSCEPLSRIFGCTMHQVPAFMATAIKQGYLLREHRDGVLHFAVAIPAVEAEPAPLTPSPVSEFALGYEARVNGWTAPELATHEWMRGWNAYVPPLPEVLPEPDPVKAVDWHAYGKDEKEEVAALVARIDEALAPQPEPREFACAFTSEREFGLSIGGNRIDLSAEEAKVLRRMLNAMHTAELL